jgi:EAL domain-containing protein (putative c-di-GMP-specific phosphodiesterase class I)
MAYLQQLPIDVLKIDASFIAGIGSRPVDASIVRAIVGLADAMDVRCLAEGVETEAQRTFLAELGCAFGQGYLWGRPMAPDDARAWAAGLGG